MVKKMLIFSGDHPRHLYVNSLIMKKNFRCAAVIMKREKFIPNTPKFLNSLDEKNYKKHFQSRKNEELCDPILKPSSQVKLDTEQVPDADNTPSI